MNYLLTQAEYDALRDQRRKRTDEEAEKLQLLCTMAAQHIPVRLEWSPDRELVPWGCILGPKEQDPGYCDRCPARDVCPHEGKEWSQ